MVVSLALAAVLLAQSQQAAPSIPAAQDPNTSELNEVVVEGQRRREAAEAYVRSVADPVRERKTAVWRDSVCVGVVGMQPEAARFMADRISDWAAGVGLAIEEPGCEADILVVAAADGDAMARELVASRPREFRTGVAGSDQGRAALAGFQTSGRPIRWWHVSLPVNGDTGRPIGRLPGQAPFVAPPGMTTPSAFGPQGSVVLPSRLTDETQDDLRQAIVVLDTEALDHASFAQVTDYVAMVALAQIDPDSRPPNPSILNLFDPAIAQEDALTRWDRAYLNALYGSYQRSSNSGANLSTIADRVALELDRNVEEAGAEPAPAD